MKTMVTVVLLALVTAGMTTVAQADEAQQQAPSITVTGTGEATAKPDMAVVQVGVVTEAPAAEKALKENNQVMAKLFHTLAKAGVADKDIQTSSFNVAPQYRRGSQGEQLSEITGYQVANQVQVKVRHLKTLAGALDSLIGSGANQVEGISFSVAEPTRLLDDARRKAVAEARRKAELYAEAAGVELGHVLLIQEQSSQLPRPFFFGLAHIAAAVPIARGEQEFRATVTLTYALKDKADKK